MVYCYAQDFITFFEYAPIHSITQRLFILLDFIKQNLHNCVYTEVKKQVLLDKYNDVVVHIPKDLQSCDFMLITENIESDLQSLPDILLLPLGNCHGDLTLSNILFTDEKIVLIDFLDNFIETPLQDIVKLRQDTRHRWSLQLYKHMHDSIKINMILEHLDSIIHNHFARYEFYTLYYRIFQKLNLLRILPYTNNDKRFAYILHEITQIH